MRMLSSALIMMSWLPGAPVLRVTLPSAPLTPVDETVWPAWLIRSPATTLPSISSPSCSSTWMLPSWVEADNTSTAVVTAWPWSPMAPSACRLVAQASTLASAPRLPRRSPSSAVIRARRPASALLSPVLTRSRVRSPSVSVSTTCPFLASARRVSASMRRALFSAPIEAPSTVVARVTRSPRAAVSRLASPTMLPAAVTLRSPSTFTPDRVTPPSPWVKDRSVFTVSRLALRVWPLNWTLTPSWIGPPPIGSMPACWKFTSALSPVLMLRLSSWLASSTRMVPLSLLTVRSSTSVCTALPAPMPLPAFSVALPPLMEPPLETMALSASSVVSPAVMVPDCSRSSPAMVSSVAAVISPWFTTEDMTALVSLPESSTWPASILPPGPLVTLPVAPVRSLSVTEKVTRPLPVRSMS